MSALVKGARIPAAVVDAKLAAETIVARAQAEAAALLVRAQAEAAAQRAEAAAAGQASGRAQGHAEAAAVLAAAHAGATRAREASSAELTRLAVRMAERIVGRELALAPETIVAIARETLAHAGHPRKLLLRVHPDDEVLVTAAGPELTLAFEQATLEVRADPGLARGDCVVDTEAGSIDGRLEVQLAAFERALLKVVT